MTDDDTRFPALAVAGAAILRLLTQVEERMARHPRSALDPGLATTLTHIRQEAGDLVELYAYVTRPGLCSHCGSVDVPLVAAMSSDPGLEVCEACELDPDLATFLLSALGDDREVWTVTRGDVVWLAGREVTDGEVSRLAAVIGDSTAGTVAEAVAAVCGASPLPLDSSQGSAYCGITSAGQAVQLPGPALPNDREGRHPTCTSTSFRARS